MPRVIYYFVRIENRLHNIFAWSREFEHDIPELSTITTFCPAIRLTPPFPPPDKIIVVQLNDISIVLFTVKSYIFA